MSKAALDLFRLAEAGEIELSTSDAHVAEAAFVLSTKGRYKIDAERCAGLLSALLRVRAMKFPGKLAVLEALQVWAERPSLGFPDALAVVYGRESGTQLATFDYALRRMEGVHAWTPNDSGD